MDYDADAAAAAVEDCDTDDLDSGSGLRRIGGAVEIEGMWIGRLGGGSRGMWRWKWGWRLG